MAEASVRAIVDLMVGRRIEQLFPRSARVRGEPLLEVSELAGLHGKPARASFTLHRGEVLGIAGLVGAGRTEPRRAGWLRPTPVVSGRCSRAQTSIRGGQHRPALAHGLALRARTQGGRVGAGSQRR